MVDRLPPTPFLAIDLPVLQANIERVAAWADDRGLALRPHVKTHKSPEIAHMQEDAGVGGVTLANVREGEGVAHGGFDDLFVG